MMDFTITHPHNFEKDMKSKMKQIFTISKTQNVEELELSIDKVW